MKRKRPNQKFRGNPCKRGKTLLKGGISLFYKKKRNVKKNITRV